MARLYAGVVWAANSAEQRVLELVLAQARGYSR
jgi:hypothetical protein